MLAAGSDLAAVAAQPGHKNIATTGLYYAHAVAGAQRKAAALLPISTLLPQRKKDRQPEQRKENTACDDHPEDN